tara:strand:+ start:464 stop:652 length:189 start_codon:yes stop_codon:yes gene_type:complete
MIWTIFFTLYSYSEHFTVGKETLRTDKADLPKVLSEHIETIMNRWRHEARQKRQAKKELLHG